MGYHVNSFKLLAELSRRGDLTGVKKILDLGSQEVGLGDHDHPHALFDFFSAMQCELPSEAELLTLHSAHSRKVFERAGFDYTSLDVNGQGGSQQFDLNFDSVPEADRNRFDLVMNQGTIEHVLNIANGFRVMHDWTRPGGLMFHHMPFMQYLDHGFLNIQPNLYTALAKHNDYDILGIWINLDRGRLHFIPWERRILEALDLNRAHLNLAVLLRKRSDTPFNIPVQGTYAEELTEQALLKYSYSIDATTVQGRRGLVEMQRGEMDFLRGRMLQRLPMRTLLRELQQRLRSRLGI